MAGGAARPPGRSAVGRVIALTSGLSRGCSVLALTLGGWAGTAFGPRAYFVVAGLAAAALGPLLLTARRHVRAAGAAPADPVPATTR